MHVLLDHASINNKTLYAVEKRYVRLRELEVCTLSNGQQLKWANYLKFMDINEIYAPGAPMSIHSNQIGPNHSK